MTTISARFCLAVAVAVLPAIDRANAEVFDVPLRNASFSEGVDDTDTPQGWSRYGERGAKQQLKVVDVSQSGKALLILDGDPAAGGGVVQTVDLRENETYEVSVEVRAREGVSNAGAHLQFRFLPSNEFVQTALAPLSSRRFSRVAVRATAPPGTTRAAIYLYTHSEPTPAVFVTSVKLIGGLPAPPPPPPPPVPPQYDKLKDLHLDISLVEDGRPTVVIVTPASGLYQAAADAIQAQIARQSGVTVPIVSDESEQAAVPIQSNLILLGNRSTNRTIRALYDQHFCLVDLKYPGPAGYVLRSVHNPFGSGHSLVVVGGSDALGVDAGAQALAGILSKSASPSTHGKWSLGWIMETRLGNGIKPPSKLEDFEIWDASKGYGSTGYFGWCSISKRMAMYYMTGDEFNAREFVRLAFPDEQALEEISRIDGERIENKNDPLAGFYHYNAHMAILLWDLIEESPVFTDQERLRITNAFARQLDHRKGEGIYGLTRPPAQAGSRHGQWSAISLYCLGRYFQRDYPGAVWAQCVRAGQLAFHSLHEHGWLAGESDNLFWYNTGIAPVLTYMVLTGDRKPLDNGVLGELLRGHEILISGRVPDWALNSASIGYLNQAAYLTGDGRWLAYRQRTGVDLGGFRLGQSFWPDERLAPAPPQDLVGRWSILALPEPAWNARGSGLPGDQSFYVASFRSEPDAGGDFILLDGFNGASRNPYHTFAILELRIGGRTVLQGYHNQVLTRADGMVEPAVAMDAALVWSDVLGPMATAVGEVPAAAFCNWRRTLAQRTGRYALVVDDLRFRTRSQNIKVSTAWQAPGGVWNQTAQAIRSPVAGAPPASFEIRSCDVQEVSSRGGVLTMDFHGAVDKGSRRIAFSLVGLTPADSSGAWGCIRIADNAAALMLPQPALAVVGERGPVSGELVVLAEDHLYGHALIDGMLASSDAPVDLDWDFTHQELNVVASKPTTLSLSLKRPGDVRLDGNPVQADAADGRHTIRLAPGRHLLTGAAPAAEDHASLLNSLAGVQTQGQEIRTEALATADRSTWPAAPELSQAMVAKVGGTVTEMVQVPSAAGTQLCIAEGATIHVLSSAGQPIRTLHTDAEIRVLRWWDEHRLLLAGCVDEQVIAFDADGRRKWAFTSAMDPAVFAAAKHYWFKTARGHEGIHGLHTGEFDGGQSRCFVGSACTLEILDERGHLVKRTPIFWGPGRMFCLVPGPEGSKNLLIARWLNGNDTLAIVNSRTLAETGRGFFAVPAGHSYVGGWSAQNRTAVLHEDLDGDGTKEVVTACNGTWNRVSVYSEDGRPLNNAQFGPGASTAVRAQMRDLAITDLDGDGQREIVVGISEGLVVALTRQCQKLWSTRLPSLPVSLNSIIPAGGKLPWTVVGCEDGTVAALDQNGAIVGIGKVKGRPIRMEMLTSDAGTVLVVATDQGELKGFELRVDEYTASG